MSSRLALSETLARILGALVFLVGIWLLWQVYTDATALFNAAPTPTPTPVPTPKPSPGATPAPTDAAGAAVALGRDMTDYLKRLLALLLMCVAGSLIASQGVRAIFGPSPTRPPGP